jgi:hypothetical protein
MNAKEEEEINKKKKETFVGVGGDQGVVHIYADETGNRQPAKTRGGEKGAPRDPGLLLLADPTRTHITSHQIPSR